MEAHSFQADAERGWKVMSEDSQPGPDRDLTEASAVGRRNEEWEMAEIRSRKTFLTG